MATPLWEWVDIPDPYAGADLNSLQCLLAAIFAVRAASDVPEQGRRLATAVYCSRSSTTMAAALCGRRQSVRSSAETTKYLEAQLASIEEVYAGTKIAVVISPVGTIL